MQFLRAVMEELLLVACSYTPPFMMKWQSQVECTGLLNRQVPRDFVGSNPTFIAILPGVAELADAHDLGSCAARRKGSIPFTRTIIFPLNGYSTEWARC